MTIETTCRHYATVGPPHTIEPPIEGMEKLIDNLNASIHIRALLTDLFLIDETLKLQHISGKPATTT